MILSERKPVKIPKRRRGVIVFRIVCMFLVVLSIPVALILSVMTGAFYDANAKELLRNQHYSMNQVVENFNNYFKHIDQMTQDVIYNDAIQLTLANTKISSTTRFRVESLIMKKGYLDGLYVAYIDGNGNIYKTSNMGYSDLYLSDMLPKSRIFQIASREYARLCFSMDQTDLCGVTSQNSAAYSLFVGRRIRHLEMDVAPGYIIIMIPQNKIRELLGDPLMHLGTRYLLMTETGEIVTDSANEFKSGTMLDDPTLLSLYRAGDSDYSGSLSLGDKQYVFGKLKESDLWLLSCLSVEDSAEIDDDMRRLLFTVALIGALAAIVLALVFSDYFTKPLLEILHAVRKVRSGDLSVRVKPRHNDEVGELAETYNAMATDMSKLIEQVRSDQRILKNAEINALIYQINPHFLYNTLDNINMLARKSEDKRMSLLITELSNLLRITLSGGQDLISVSDEIRHVESYLKIMRLRSGEAFTYEIKTDGDLNSVNIIKLILQPLVENAIQHGLQYTDEGGIVRVTAKHFDEMLILTVADNGVGMSDEQIIALEEKLKHVLDVQPTRNKHVGLSNVYRRIKLFYGDAGGQMTFARSSSGGLEVRLTLDTKPKQ